MPLVIHVGGSGQHTGLMTSRLMLLGAMGPDWTCRVVDADDEQAGIAGALQTLDGYVKPGYAHPMRGVDAYIKPFNTAALAGGEDETSFRTLFQMSEDARLDREVFEALFTPEQGALDIRQGFFAMPSLGAAAFAAQGEQAIKDLRASVGNERQVFITGSFIGGTGAGVIPSAVQQLTKDSTADWFGVFLLNWLAPAADAVPSRDDMESNRRHGLEYFYTDVRPHLKGSVLLGPPPGGGGNLAKPAVPSRRPETRSIYPLLASRAMYQLSTDAMTNFGQSVFVWSHDEAQPDALLDKPWHGQLSLRQRLHDAERVEHWLGLYEDAGARDSLEKAFGIFGTKSAVPRGLHGLNTYARAGQVKLRPFIDLVMNELKHRRAGLREAYLAFREVFGTLGSDPISEHYEDNVLAGLKAASTKEHTPDQRHGKPAELAAELARHLIADVSNYRG